MGCLIAKLNHFSINRQFSVGFGPSQTRDFLADRNNWPQIIPGFKEGVDSTPEVSCEVSSGVQVGELEIAYDPWFLKIGELTYFFTEIRSSGSADVTIEVNGKAGAFALRYTVNVKGKSSGLPVHFSFGKTAQQCFSFLLAVCHLFQY